MLLKYSEAKRWEDARQEWRLNHIWYADIEDARTCECGHYPICEICVVENEVNDTILEIGNCCVNQISPEFDALKRIFPALREGRINPAIIDYAFKQIRHKIYENIRFSPKQLQAIYTKWGIDRDLATKTTATEATA